jgi:hypothetical protein
MIFRQIDEILDGRKTQTRRVARDYWQVRDVWYTESRAYGDDMSRIDAVVSHPIIACVENPAYRHRIKWQVGRTYAIQPKRGAPGIKTHRIQITGIRQERLQDISETDVEAEGVGLQSWAAQGNEQWPRTAGYAELWTSINTRKGVRWEDNPLVWVLEFECVEVEPGA